MQGPYPCRILPSRTGAGGEVAIKAAYCLGERQRGFAAAIVDPDRPVPHGLIGPDGKPDAKRFAVYRNNVVAGLIESLKAGFPAVRRIVGDEFFSVMARIHSAQEPPRSPVMLDYGAGFADFIGRFKPAAELPYLRDVARLEHAWLEAYHAAEALPIEPDALMGIEPDRIASVGFVLHPSVRLVGSTFPAVTIWHMNVGAGVPCPVDTEGGGEDALVVRPAAEVEVRVVPAGTATFVRAIAVGAKITDATAFAIDDHPGFDLAGALSELLSIGAIVGVNQRGDTNAPASQRSL